MAGAAVPPASASLPCRRCNGYLCGAFWLVFAVTMLIRVVIDMDVRLFDRLHQARPDDNDHQQENQHP
jgi:hypothetical protein